MTDGETGTFTTFLVWDEVTVEWTWFDGEDWEADGFFDIFVYRDGQDITYDIPKTHFKWIEDEVKELTGYQPPTYAKIQQAISVYNSHF